MIVNTAIFTCSICGEASTNICAYCTKDACSNHRCERCKRCSDCCECEVPLSAEEPAPVQAEPLPEQTQPPFAEANLEAPSEESFVLTAAESSVFVEGSLPPELVASKTSESSETDDADAWKNPDEPQVFHHDSEGDDSELPG